MSTDLKLNDLQKLAINYLNSVGQLNAISAMSGNPFGHKMANHHIPLIKSILGESIMEMLNHPVKAKKLARLAEDFYDLMVDENFDEKDPFGSSDD